MKSINRLYKYLEYKEVKPTRFEKEIGLSNVYLGTQFRREANLGEEILLKIINNCLDISPEWLLTGHGSMLKSEIKEGTEVVKASSDEQQAIPLVNINAVAGFGRQNALYFLFTLHFLLL